MPDENLNRVTERISTHVSTFISERVGKEFHVEELRRHVSDHVKGYISPDSPGRIMRDLRARGEINYTVVSRSQSLYKALPVKGQMELFG